MRKDIFITGARLLGVWELAGALTPLSYMLGSWVGYIRPQYYSEEYNFSSLVVHLLVGVFLIFRAHRLFDLLNRLSPEATSAGNGEEGADEEAGL